MAIPNTIECNNNASQKGVSTLYIIRGQFVGVNKPSRLNAYRYHCAEGLARRCDVTEDDYRCSNDNRNITMIYNV